MMMTPRVPLAAGLQRTAFFVPAMFGLAGTAGMVQFERRAHDA